MAFLSPKEPCRRPWNYARRGKNWRRFSGAWWKSDLEWERSHNPMFITDLERRAARELKLDKPWLYDPKPHAECPACGEKIKPGVAVCRTCGAILDREKAAKFGLGVVEQRTASDDAQQQKTGSRKN